MKNDDDMLGKAVFGMVGGVIAVMIVFGIASGWL